MKVLEPARILGFSGKSLMKERMVEMIFVKCEFQKIYHISLRTDTGGWSVNCATPVFR